MKSCIICYDETSDENSCCDTKCEIVICADCFINFMTHCFNENQLPICPGEYCNNEYLYLDLKKNIIVIYEKIYMRFLKNKTLNNISNIQNQKILINKLRNEKLEYINKEFPKAIYTLINIGLSNNLKKISKNNNKMFEKMKQNKKCFKILCNGILDENSKCISCQESFCEKCERKITLKHICKEEDLLSIETVSLFVCCPKCNTPIVRSYGCNYITCALCKTNFHYITGKCTKSGNHVNEQLLLKTNNSLLDLYKKQYPDLHDELSDLDLLKPKEVSFNNVVYALKNNTSNKNCITKYNEYILFKNKNKIFNKVLDEIQENKLLTRKFLVEIKTHLK